MENRLLPVELKGELGMKYRICMEECLLFLPRRQWKIIMVTEPRRKIIKY